MNIICFGDSNTYGWDPREFSTNRYDVQWPQLLQEMTGHHVVNMGQPGREIYYRGYQYRWFDDYVNRENHDLLIIMLGSNDILNSPVPDIGSERYQTAGAIGDEATAQLMAESNSRLQNQLEDRGTSSELTKELPESGTVDASGLQKHLGTENAGEEITERLPAPVTVTAGRPMNSGAARVLERMSIFLQHINEKKLSDNILVLSPPAMKLPEALARGSMQEMKLPEASARGSMQEMKLPEASARGSMSAEAWYNEAVREAAVGLRNVCEAAGVRYVDSTGWDIPLAFDGIHFTEEGHKIFAAKVKEIIGQNQ